MGEFQDKNVGVVLKKGTSQKKAVVDERDGSVGGHHIEHWDGSQDAEIIAKTTRVKGRAQEGNE